MNTDRTMHRSTVRILLATALLLSIPLVVMQFTDGVAWTPFDFVFMGVLIAGTGLTYARATRVSRNLVYRAAFGAALAGSFLLIWISGAVGIIGSSDDPANLMYFGVLAVGVIGAVVARFRARGMARVMFAMAFAQALVAAIALIAGSGYPASPPLEILGLTGFFVVLFAGSALLFRRAAHREGEPAAT